MIAALLILLAGLVVLGGVVLIRWGDARAWRASLVTYKLTLPQTLTTADVAAWLAHVVATTHATRLAVRTPPALALEVTADSRGITHTLIVPKNLTGSVLAGLRATLPAARIEEKPRAVGAAYALAAEARLTSLLRPLAHDRAGLASTSILASLQPLGSGEQIALQWVFTGVPTPAPATTANTTLSADAARSARLKLAEPMLQAVVRLGVKADSQARAASLFGQVGATDYPVGLNALNIGRGETAQELAVDHLVHLMASLWHSSWGPRTSDVLRMALLTLVSARSADGSPFTLIELPELLLNPAFRLAVTTQASVPATVRSFWLAYEQMSDGERAQVIGPSLNKVSIQIAMY